MRILIIALLASTPALAGPPSAVSTGVGARAGAANFGSVSVISGRGNPSASSFGLSAGQNLAPAAAGTVAVGTGGFGAAAAYGLGRTTSGATTGLR